MAPKGDDKKRKRAATGPSQESSFSSKDRFRSYEHEKRYKTEIHDRNFVQEKAIVLEGEEYPEIQEQIQGRGWETLISYPEPGCQMLVKEFYANAYAPNKEDEKFVSFVRGQRIQFDPGTLNDFLKTTRRASSRACGYMSLTSERVNAERLLETLCRPGAQWSLNKDNEPRKLKASELKPIPKAWCTFVHHTLQPCANVSDVIVSRAQLVHAIVTGLDIDVGRVIAYSIQGIANGTTGATLGHPSLITHLCLAAGVPVSLELPIKPMEPVTAKYIRRLPSSAVGAEQQPPPPPPPAAAEQQPPSASLEQRVQRLEGNVRALCRLSTLIFWSQHGLETMLRRLGEQLHLDVDALGGLPSMPMTEAEILAQMNFDDVDSEPEEQVNDIQRWQERRSNKTDTTQSHD